MLSRPDRDRESEDATGVGDAFFGLPKPCVAEREEVWQKVVGVGVNELMIFEDSTISRTSKHFMPVL